MDSQPSKIVTPQRAPTHSHLPLDVPAPTVRDLLAPQALAPPAAPLPGRVAGYEVLAELGRGGMGIVYLVRQPGLDRLAALKMDRSPRSTSRERERFRAEAQAIARLQHPHIVQVFEVGEHDGLPFFSMEFCEGGNLADRLRHGPLPVREAARLLADLARAVQAAHEAGVVHRDLKPANVLLAADGAPKLTDFGLAKRLDASGLTQAGEILGTPAYMAPEQAGAGQVAPAADIYSLGAVLYECLTGRPPFLGATALEVLTQVRDRDPVSPRRLVPGVPRDLETVCLTCLHKSAHRRYRSARELADDLDCFLADRSIRARPVGAVGRVLRWARRCPGMAALVGLSLLLLVALGAAIPSWYLARAQQHVAEVRADALAERQATRRARLEADCARHLVAGREALARADLEGAATHFLAVQERIDDRDANEAPALARLRAEAERRWAIVVAQQQSETQRREARGRAQQFLALRDEALFELHRNLVDPTSPSGLDASARLARSALALFPDLEHLAGQRGPLRAARTEVWLVLAEAMARPRPGDSEARRRVRAEEALRLLQGLESAQIGPALHRRRARYLEQQGDRTAAALERSRAEGVRPVSALDWFLSGHERWLAGDPRGAIADLERALADDPALFWGWFLRALAWQQLGRPTEALAGLGECVRLRPDFPWAYLLRGYLHGRAGRFDDAEADFRRVAGFPLDTLARYALHVHRGVLALRRKHADQAIQEFVWAARLRPFAHHAHANLAQAYHLRGEGTRVRAALDRAIALAPDLPDLYRSRARRRLEAGDNGGCLADFDVVLRSGARARDHQDRALALYRLGRHADAVRACDLALEASPGVLTVHRVRGEALLQLGRHRAALADLDVCLRQPDADLYRQRALAQVALGAHREASAEATHGLRLRPDDGRLLAVRGWANLLSGAPLLAREDFDEALVSSPNLAEAYAGRGLARARLGERGAVADAETALREGPRTARLHYNVARVYALSAMPDRAVEQLRLAVDGTPREARTSFWAEVVARDPALASLRRRPAYGRLEEALTRPGKRP